MAIKTFTTARVRVTVDVQLTRPWGDACTMQQIMAEAKKEAVEVVRARLETGSTPRMTIHTAPVVTMVLVEESDR